MRITWRRLREPFAGPARIERPAGARRPALGLGLWAITVAATAQPLHVYLTWQGDTSRTMTVNYQTAGHAPASWVYYDTRPRGGEAEAYRYQVPGGHHQIPGLADGRWVHVVELTGLQPGKTYYFIAGDSTGGFSPERQFRTIPSGDGPLRFVTGGDMGVGELPQKLMAQAALHGPQFAAIGGDIAYANGRLENIGLWDQWLEAWERWMVTPEGLTIPMALAIGNHEVNGAYNRPKENAPFYFGFFAQAEESYFSRRFGANLVFLFLDTGHIAAHGGPQAAWLEAELARHRNARYTFAVYHVPLYPSHRDYEGAGSQAGRAHWAPLFDRYGLTTAFENHDHTFKRSKLLKEGKPDPDGTLYLGDGCFGRAPRTVDAELRWYLDRAESIAHFWLVDVTRRSVRYRAFDAEGRRIDVYPPEK